MTLRVIVEDTGTAIIKNFDNEKIYLHMSDFVDNESFELFLSETFNIERTPENDIQGVTLTISKVETY